MTVKVDASHWPEMLPPRFIVPGARKLRWSPPGRASVIQCKESVGTEATLRMSEKRDVAKAKS